MATYTAQITFDTDRKLTINEITAIESAVYLQMKEPWDFANDEIDVATTVHEFNFKEVE